MTRSRNILEPRRPWTDAELALLRRCYPHMKTDIIARQLERRSHVVSRQAIKLRLHKSQEYLASPDACRLRRGDNVGVRTRFPKGHVPANKGTRRPGWSAGRMKETQFKKGRPAHESYKYKPIGSLRLSKDGYLERKVTDDPRIVSSQRWIGVHRLVWEAAHGRVPPGHAVAFLPGRRTTDVDRITVDALELVSRAELMRRNSYHFNYPKELARVIQLRGAVQRQINRRRGRHAQQD